MNIFDKIQTMNRPILNISRALFALLMVIQLIDLIFRPLQNIFPDSDMIWAWAVYEIIIWAVLETAIFFVAQYRKDKARVGKILDPLSLVLLVGITTQYLAILLGLYTKYDHFDQITHFSIMGIVGSMIVYRFVWAFFANLNKTYLAGIALTIMMALNTMHEIAEYIMIEFTLYKYPYLYAKFVAQNDLLDTGNDLLMVLGGTLSGLVISYLLHQKRKEPT